MKMMKKIITTLLFGALSMSAFSFLISDITFDEEIGGNGYKEYKITNDGRSKSIYKVSLIPLDNPESIKGMTVYPKVLPVEANSSAILKIFGGDKATVPNGEYRFMLSFKPIVVPTLKKDKNDGKITGTVGTGLVPDIEMRGYVGHIDFEKDLQITDIKFTKNENNKVVASFNVENNSYGGVTVGALFYDEGKNVSYSERIGRIGSKSKVPVNMVLQNFTKEDEIKIIQLYTTSGDKVDIKKTHKIDTKILK